MALVGSEADPLCVITTAVVVSMTITVLVTLVAIFALASLAL